MLRPLLGFAGALTETIGFIREEWDHIDLCLKECFIRLGKAGTGNSSHKAPIGCRLPTHIKVWRHSMRSPPPLPPEGM
ncbi:hypothetical protein DSCOOX_48690 [Desulfosarcina ovata subsp. ovata]|uniref:Uncharacterized protein n=1 Tax=Desulfosarcina ovata subsp. ovata TaxID=2752305 RepID=A0A5K8AGR0_9BACT|nr:hypothetical protein DSCOOX_48690 [Desulfosarcina ovata subsp. ovata]